MKKTAPHPHSPEWYDRLSERQKGYYYPWRSSVAPGNGEDAFLELLDAHLSAAKTVLDVGCGHGEVAMSIAPRCREVVAYDRVESYVRMARKKAGQRRITNVSFLLADSSEKANGGRARIPADDGVFELLVSRRGPLHWIEDAKRVAKPGATLLQLNPTETPTPEWNEFLPTALRFDKPDGDIRSSVESRLEAGGLELHSCWIFDVPEYFDDPEQLYLRLAWGEDANHVPPFSDVRDALEKVFAEYAVAEGLALRHRRFLWKAATPS